MAKFSGSLENVKIIVFELKMNYGTLLRAREFSCIVKKGDSVRRSNLNTIVLKTTVKFPKSSRRLLRGHRMR